MPTAVPPWLKEDRCVLPPGSTDEHRVTWFVRAYDLPDYGAALDHGVPDTGWAQPVFRPGEPPHLVP